MTPLQLDPCREHQPQLFVLGRVVGNAHHLAGEVAVAGARQGLLGGDARLRHPGHGFETKRLAAAYRLGQCALASASVALLLCPTFDRFHCIGEFRHQPHQVRYLLRLP